MDKVNQILALFGHELLPVESSLVGRQAKKVSVRKMGKVFYEDQF